jgi:hypothetical protein
VSTGPERESANLRAGLGVLGVAVRREPWIFAVSTLGSVVFGALTVADAWVLGWATDHRQEWGTHRFQARHGRARGEVHTGRSTFQLQPDS